MPFKKGHKIRNTGRTRFKKGGKKPLNAFSFPKGYKQSENHKKNIGLGNKGNHSINEFKKGHKGYKAMLGKSPSKSTKEKISEGLKALWENPEYRKQMIEVHVNSPNRIFKDTKIELKIEAELKRININYQKQVPLCKIAIVDFYLPGHRIVIQCDGDHWHNRPGCKEKDERQDKVLTFNGFNVYRFWEHEINKSAKKCLEIIFNN